MSILKMFGAGAAVPTGDAGVWIFVIVLVVAVAAIVATVFLGKKRK